MSNDTEIIDDHRSDSIMQSHDQVKLMEYHRGPHLGPLLFIYYINALIELTFGDNIILFADDVVIHDGRTDLEDLKSSMQGYLETVVKWCTNNRMKMNESKTKLMTINEKLKDEIKLQTPEGGIGNTRCYKYLGVWLDNSLDMNRHLNNGYKMAYQKVFKLEKAENADEHCHSNASYKQTILPYFEYCDFLIDSCSKKELDKLEKLQYIPFRIVHKIRNPRDISRVNLLSLSGLTELKVKQKCHLLNQMFIWKSKGKWLKQQIRAMRNQHLQQFYLPKPNTKETKKSPFYRGARLWLKFRQI